MSGVGTLPDGHLLLDFALSNADVHITGFNNTPG